MTNTTAVPRNAMSVDVEEYFQVSAFAPYIDAAHWDQCTSRVAAQVERVLALFARHGVHATFFILGWIAERHPDLVRRIVQAGHEVASHGMRHVRASQQTPAEFKADVSRAKTLLEDIAGQPVQGYRAASFSIGAANLWALDVLAEAGYCYSSSIYPVRHDHYGMPEAPRFAHRPRAHNLTELPIATVRIGQRTLPCGGGGYFRLYPYCLSRWALARVNAHDQQPAVFYFHPWELDPQQPRPPGLSAKTRFRHYINLGRMERKLARVLSDFAWDRIDRVFGLS